MSGLCPFPPNSPYRLAVDIQRDALAPFPIPRIHRAPWDLNRKPYDFRELTEFGWLREAELELGEDILPEPDPRAPSAPRIGGGLAGTPRTLGWSWALQAIGASGALSAICTEVIPFPFRITGFGMETSDLAVAANHSIELQLVLVDEDISATGLVDVPGEHLIPRLGGSGIAGTAYGLRFNARTNALASTQSNINNAAAMVIGRTCLIPGKRIAIAIKQVTAVTVSFHGFITVEEYGAVAQIAPRFTSTPQVSAARVTAARAPAGTTRPGTEPPYGSLTYWQNQVAINSRAPSTPYKQQQLAAAKSYVAWLSSPPIPANPVFIGQVSTAQDALNIAALLKARGETARAAIYTDMAKRMNAGLSVTLEQEALLAFNSDYQPIIQKVFLPPATPTAADIAAETIFASPFV